LLLVLACLVGLPAWGAAAHPASPSTRGATVLAADVRTADSAPATQVWLDDRGTATLQDALQAASRFGPADPDAVHRLGGGAALWMRLRLVRAEDDPRQWLLAFTNPVLDHVTVWQQDERGRWHSATAGDTVAVRDWPESGRYPVFRLDLPPGQPRDVLVRVRSLTPTSVPLRLAPDAAHVEQAQLEYLGLGMAFGTLLLLIAACLAQSWAYRDRVYLWYALYATISTLGVMAYTGVAAHLLWPFSGAWADSSQGSLALLAAGAAMLFVRSLTGISARHVHLERLAQVGGWIGLALALAYPLLQRQPAITLLSAYVLMAAAVNMTVAWLSWRRGDVVGFWVLVAYLPLTLSVVLALVRLFGLLPVSFATQYAVVVAMAMEVPLLLVALSIRSRDRHGAEIREQALSSQDALTGLLAPHLFRDRLQQVVSRFKRDREDAAIVFIQLVNHGRIQAHHGSAVAEQSLLRSVIKLRRLVRDVDTVARVGEARFGLIMEGVHSRAVVTDRAARLIAAGLMPLQGLKPDVTLQFHIAAVLLRERMVEAAELPGLLEQLLASMSPRTRRPIRFLQAEDTQPAPLGADAASAGPDSELPEEAPALTAR
jgi:diguanylate cyclase (GGDEF)-like protein